VEQNGHQVGRARTNLFREVGERCAATHRDDGRSVPARNANATERRGFAELELGTFRPL
jgi:hypothetical protein